MLKHRLVLFDWAIHQLGGESFTELRNAINRPDLEGITPEHTTRFAPELERLIFDGAGHGASETDRFIENRDMLAEMDANIVRHWRQLAARRTRMGQEIHPTYFQYLSLLATEVYLRAYITERGRLLASLNKSLERFNANLSDAGERVSPFEDADLNHLAFWNATGSGKTLIMHANLLQFRHYASRFPRQAPHIDQVILITPPGTLISGQHLAEFELSGIQTQRFSSAGPNMEMFRGLEHPVQVIEISRLADETKEKQVNIEEFETSNLVFVDEGHKGTGGNNEPKDQRGWLNKRQRLSETGFSFEYSATFGQALKDSGQKDLADRYGKSVLVEYSYPRFYHDGYGKEYRIMNFPGNSATQKDQLRRYFFANLVWFYQQLRVFDQDRAKLHPFLIHKPLLAFVGSSVVQTGKQDLSDVATVIDLIAQFAENRDGTAVRTIQEILADTLPLEDNHGKSIFAGEFRYVRDKTLNLPATTTVRSPEQAAPEVYRDIKKALFHHTDGNLSIERLTGSSSTEGELLVRLGAAPEPFAVITVGESKKLADHLQAGNEGRPVAHVTERAIADSYFATINDDNSTITMLIGAKKFIEGWSSWRVSSIGLMNIGRSQGPQVIQLFGRGVRLKGYDFRLKRARELQGDQRPAEIPNNIDYVETLSVFGVRADYVNKFQEIIESEEGAVEYEEVPIPRVPLHRERYKELAYIDVNPEKKDKRKLPVWDLAVPSENEAQKLHVSVTWSVALQAFFSKRAQTAVAERTNLEELRFRPEHLNFIDFDTLHAELVDFKNNQRYFNLSISPQALRDLLADSSDIPWYTLRAPAGTLSFDHVSRIAEWQEIAQVLLRNYVKRFYEYRRAAYENQFLRVRSVQPDEGGLAQEQVLAYLPKKSGQDVVEDGTLLEAVQRVQRLVQEGWGNGANQVNAAGLKALHLDQHIYTPLLHLNRTDTARISPAGLNDGEAEFAEKLSEWFKANGSPIPDTEVFFFRNESRGRGLGFFIADNFYPDFILWFLSPEKQGIVFVDPKGIRNLGGFEDPKLNFHQTIKEVEAKVNNGRSDSWPPLRLESFILSRTPFEHVTWNLNATSGRRSKQEFEDRHVIFMSDADYMDKLMKRIRDGA